MSQHTPGRSYPIATRWSGSRFCGCRVVRDRYRPVVEECKLHAATIDLLAALTAAFLAMGRAGANADTTHPLRPAWEQARVAMSKAEEG